MAKYTFIATGDVGPNREDPDEMFDQVRDVLHSADLVFGQLEPCIAASGSPACQPRLPMRCRPEMAEAISEYKDRACGWKVTGCGGGGYLLLISEQEIPNTIKVTPCGAEN